MPKPKPIHLILILLLLLASSACATADPTPTVAHTEPLPTNIAVAPPTTAPSPEPTFTLTSLPPPPTAAPTPLGGGGLISFSTERYQTPDTHAIAILNLQDNAITRVSPQELGYCLDSDWSPDGAQIVANCAVAHDRGELNMFVMNADGSQSTQIVTGHTYSPSWSSTGQIVMSFRRWPTSDISDTRYELFLTNPDGSQQDYFTRDDTDYMFPDWSPDGTMIASGSPRLNSDIVVINLATGDKTNLTQFPGHDLWPAWSPDGGRIAFVSDRRGSFDLFVMDADGSNQIQLTDDPADDSWPTWSPDGQYLAFASERDGNWNLYLLHLESGLITQLTDDPGDDFRPSWSWTP